MKGKNMKKEYKLGKLKKRSGLVKSSPKASKVAISLRIDGDLLADIRTEAERLNIPYQTLMGSILHRYASGELVDLKAVNIDELIKRAS